MLLQEWEAVDIEEQMMRGRGSSRVSFLQHATQVPLCTTASGCPQYCGISQNVNNLGAF